MTTALKVARASKRRVRTTAKSVALSRAIRSLYAAQDLDDPCAEIVRDIAALSADSLNQLPALIERARTLVKEGAT